MFAHSNKSIAPTFTTQVVDELAQVRDVDVVAERALVIYVDDREIVTLMTLGMNPEALVLGYLRNQRFIKSLDELISIEVDWDNESAKVITKDGIKDLVKKMSSRVITTGCGQGTAFSCTIDEVYNKKLSAQKISQNTVYQLLKNLNTHNQIYKSAGAVHSCALCQGTEVVLAVEDVGRHNAADIIAGLMWLKQLNNTQDFIFYTTGRITSEIVMKIAQMGIAVILSRSGVTQMGLEIAQDVGIMIIARAKGKHFLVFSNNELLTFDNHAIN